MSEYMITCCPKCSTYVPGGIYCIECGRALAGSNFLKYDIKKCIICKKEIPIHSKYCAACGEKQVDVK